MVTSPYKIRTIEELENAVYGAESYIKKADDPLTTADAGAYNPVFGAYAWAQLNLEANAFGVLPKYLWKRSGVRLITSRMVLTTLGGNTTTLGGTPEGGLLAETTSVVPVEVEIKPKTMQLPIAVSEIQEYLANNAEDDIWGGLGALRLFAAIQHKEFINKALLADREKVAAGATANNSGTDDFETLDAIISSDAEEDAVGGSFSGYYDPWLAIDRDTTTDYDSTVVSPSGTLGTNGVLQDSTVRGFLKDIRKKCGYDPTLFLGSHDAYAELQAIYSVGTRYNVLGEQTFNIDVNGIRSFDGHGVGLTISTIYQIPFVASKDAPSNANDTAEIGRIFALDISDAEGWGTPALGFKVLDVTRYAEVGPNTDGWPFLAGGFTAESVFWTKGESVAVKFHSQGKIRDITT